jgi:hypothetical protein
LEKREEANKQFGLFILETNDDDGAWLKCSVHKNPSKPLKKVSGLLKALILTSAIDRTNQTILV